MATWSEFGTFLAREKVSGATFDAIKRRFDEIAVKGEVPPFGWDYVLGDDRLADQFESAKIDLAALDAIVGGDMDLAALETAANKKSA